MALPIGWSEYSTDRTTLKWKSPISGARAPADLHGGMEGATAREPVLDYLDDADGEVLFLNWEQHAAKCLASLHEMYLTGTLCDVTVCSESQEITCHRAVLASASAYFSAMFTSNMREHSMSVVRVMDVCGESLRALVDFAYTGLIQITRRNVESLMQASSFLQVEPVLSACGEYLLKFLDVSNCCSFVGLAEMHGCELLRRAAYHYCLDEFTAVTSTDDFLGLSPAALVWLLSSDLLNVWQEETVYYAVMRWVKNGTRSTGGGSGTASSDARSADHGCTLRESGHSTCTAGGGAGVGAGVSGSSAPACVCRTHHLKRMLAKLRWWLLQPEFLVEVVQQEAVIMQDAACSTLLMQAKDYHLLSSCNRSPPPSSCLIADPLTVGKAPCRLRASFVGNVYAVGGRGGNGDLSSLIPWSSVERYDFRENTWTGVQCMNRSRRHVAACSAKGLLFVVGGHDGSNHLSSLEVYNPLTNRWALRAPMATPRRGLTFVATGDSGPLWAIGGINDTGCQSVVERYDVESDIWTTVTPMTVQRGGSAAVTVDNHIYVAGGNTVVHSAIVVVEAYCIMLDKWSPRKSMLHARAGFGMTTVGGRIVVAGGFDDVGALSSVEVYDPTADVWSEAATMTVPRGGVSVTSVSDMVFAIGGYDGTEYLKSVEVLGNLPQQLIAKGNGDNDRKKGPGSITAAAVELSSGQRGEDVEGTPAASADIDAFLMNGQWRQVAEMGFLRAGAGVAGIHRPPPQTIPADILAGLQC